MGANEEELFFGLVTDVVGDAAGRVYVLDQQRCHVVVLSSRGEFIRTLSREGEGPGGVRRPRSLLLMDEDRIGIVQGFPGKITVVGLDDEPLRTVDLGAGEPTKRGSRLLSRVEPRDGHLVGSRLDIFARYAYADGRFTRSHVPSLDLERALGTNGRLGIGVGAQTFEGIQTADVSLEGQWIRLYGTVPLTGSSDLQWHYGYATGDIAEGSSLQVRWGYRW
ncbi:6-bladed beta-propeller [Candidatus Eisenbacteria bacterium]|uniref:6-bladed beta-propeller n=1 Tax=Eiseniibacteriota bacterium TaxID=2212470 RepID=A0ABV6YIB3_UNCEI